VFDAKERALLAYIDEFALCDGRVQDATFERLKKHFKDEEILELTYFTGLYQLNAMISRALRLEYDDIDERIVEVPAVCTEKIIRFDSVMILASVVNDVRVDPPAAGSAGNAVPVQAGA
jgi:hypothetical protein